MAQLDRTLNSCVYLMFISAVPDKESEQFSIICSMHELPWLSNVTLYIGARLSGRVGSVGVCLVASPPTRREPCAVNILINS